MNFTVSSTTLGGCLQALSRVLNSKNSLPILDSFLFEVANNALTVTASDGDNVMKSTVELVESDSDFSFCLISKTIIEAVKEFSEEPLVFEVNNIDMSVTIRYHNGKNRIPFQPAELFPRIENDEASMTSIAISASSLEKAISRSIFAVAQDDLRPVMNGLFFDLKTDNLTIVASDGHKLVRNENYAVVGNEPASFILPKKPATLLKTLLPKDGDVSFLFNAGTAIVKFANYVLSCRLIDGKFPNYNSVIPQFNPFEVTIDRQMLLSAIKRVLVFAPQNSYLVRFSLEPNKLVLSSEDADSATSATEELSCDYNGQNMSIGFKGISFVEILNNTNSQEVVLRLADPSRAGVIVPAEQEENDDLLMLIMPMLLND